MSQPTPGEWEVGWDNENDFRSVGVAESKRIICHVSPRLTLNAEDEANAVLIAAAKDLLDACEKIDAYLDMLDERDTAMEGITLREVSGATAQIQNVIKLAIAKAKGGTP